jgi:hypothetical protein
VPNGSLGQDIQNPMDCREARQECRKDDFMWVARDSEPS